MQQNQLCLGKKEHIKDTSHFFVQILPLSLIGGIFCFIANANIADKPVQICIHSLTRSLWIANVKIKKRQMFNNHYCESIQIMLNKDF